jgi:hypothetical protein
MTKLVKDIEAIVGVRRHVSEHIGRAISAEQTVYIVHSRECIESGIDLRQCPFSVALDDYGIAEEWEGWEDKPVVLELDECGFLQASAEATYD